MLKDAGLTINDIDAVFGFADGNDTVDSIEKNSYIRVFGDKLASIPVVQIKERTGEGRAGTATLQAAHAALLLSGELENDDATFIAKDGSVSKNKVNGKDLKKVLVTSFASGGSYSAVVIGRE